MTSGEAVRHRHGRFVHAHPHAGPYLGCRILVGDEDLRVGDATMDAHQQRTARLPQAGEIEIVLIGDVAVPADRGLRRRDDDEGALADGLGEGGAAAGDLALILRGSARASRKARRGSGREKQSYLGHGCDGKGGGNANRADRRRGPMRRSLGRRDGTWMILRHDAPGEWRSDRRALDCV